MTEEEAKRLTAGTVVEWDGDPDDLGIVTKFNACGFYVEWDNQAGWIDCQSAEKISLHLEC